MDIKILSKDENSLRFLLDGENPAFANALRRTMLTELPTLSIEDVAFFENSSALYEEVIAHRLGMVPIKTDLKTFNLPDKCGCKGKGCPKCQVSFTLVKKGPCTVYSGDLKPTDPKTVVSDDKIPITKLLEGRKIKLEATARLGRGKDHAKWQPGVISYQYYPHIKVIKQSAIKTAKEVCPHEVFDDKGVKNLENCDLCNSCVDNCGEDAIEVTGLDNKFIFYVESNGDLKPEKIVAEGAKLLGEKAKEFGKLIK